MSSLFLLLADDHDDDDNDANVKTAPVLERGSLRGAVMLGFVVFSRCLVLFLSLVCSSSFLPAKIYANFCRQRR